MSEQEVLEIVLRAKDELSSVMQTMGARSVAELQKIHEEAAATREALQEMQRQAATTAAEATELAASAREGTTALGVMPGVAMESARELAKLGRTASDMRERFDFREAQRETQELLRSLDGITGTRAPATIQQAAEAAAGAAVQTDRLGDEAERTGQQLDRTGRTGRTAFDRIRGAAGSVMAFLRRSLIPTVLALGGAYVGISGLQRATGNASEFQFSIAEIATIANESAEGIANLRREVTDLSVAFGTNENVVAKGLYQTLSAGFTDAADAMTVLTEATRLGTAGLASTNETVDLITTALNAYRLEVSDASRVSDVFFETVRLGKTTISELASSIGLALPLASTLGARIEEVSAAIAVMTTQGFSTSEAVTGVRNLFKQLLTEGEELDRMFRRTGERFDFNTVRARGLADTLQTLAESARNPTEAMRALGGRIDAANALFALTGDNIDSFRGTLEQLDNSTGAVERALAKILDIDAMRARQVLQALRAEALAFGDAVLRSIRNTVDELGGIEGVQVRFRTLFQELAPIIEGLTDRLGDFFQSFPVFGEHLELSVLRMQESASAIRQTFANLQRNSFGVLDFGIGPDADVELQRLEARISDIGARLRNDLDQSQFSAVHRQFFAMTGDERSALEAERAALQDRADVLRVVAEAEREAKEARRERIAELERTIALGLAESQAGPVYGPEDPAAGLVQSITGSFSGLRAAVRDLQESVGRDLDAERQRRAEQERILADAAIERAERELFVREQLLGLRQQTAETAEEHLALEHEAFRLGTIRLRQLAEEKFLTEEQTAALFEQLEVNHQRNLRRIQPVADFSGTPDAPDSAQGWEQIAAAAERELSFREALFSLQQQTATSVEDLLRLEDERHALALIDLQARAEAAGFTETELARLREQLDLIRDANRERIRTPKGDDSAKKNLAELTETQQQIRSAMSDNLGNLFVDFIEGTKSAKDAFKDFARSMISDLIRIAAFRAAAGIVDAAIFGGAPVASTTTTIVKDAAKGDVFPGEFLPIQAFSKGGIATKPMLGLIREAGQNEAVVPLPDNRSIPVKWMGEPPSSGGGGDTYVQITMAPQMLDAKSLRERVPEIADEIADAVEGALSRRASLRATVRNVSAGRG